MILDKATADRKLRRIAMEIAERNHDKAELILIGIKENGIFIAQKIAAYLNGVFPGKTTIVALSMNKKQPDVITLDREVDVDGQCVLLVDDVANSGSTMLYALKPFLNAHPEQIETVVLVERTYKKFPIDINYVGLSVATTKDENIIVEVENGEVMGAVMELKIN